MYPNLPPQLWALVIAGFLLMMIVIIVVRRLGNRHRWDDPNDDRDRSAAWATTRDVKGLITDEPDSRRLMLGWLDKKQLTNGIRRSVLICAPTGAGKTPRYVVPIVLDHGAAPAVVTSIKTDVLRLTATHRAQVGRILVFDPTDTSGLSDRCTWSPLQNVRTYADADKAAAWVTESSAVEGRSSQDQEFWDSLGRRMLAPLMFAAVAVGHGMAQVVQWALRSDEEAVAEILGEAGDVDAEDAWRAHCNTTERTKSSIYQTAWRVLEPWGQPDVKRAVDGRRAGVHTLDISALIHSTDTLYLVAPAGQQRRLTGIFEAVLNAIIEEVEVYSNARGLPLDPPLLIALDEAANAATPRRLAAIASSGANQGMLVASVWQDLGQLELVYGHDQARTILSNHTAQIFMAGINDPETTKMISDRIGSHTVTRRTHSHDQLGRVSISSHVAEEDLAPPEWLNRMAPGTAIVLIAGQKPIRVSLPAWFEDDDLRAKVDPAVAAEFDDFFAPAQRTGRRGRRPATSAR